MALKHARPHIQRMKRHHDAHKKIILNALIIATEWNEFRALDLNKIKKLMKNQVIFDLRNIYNKEEVEDLGIEYHGVGQ